MYINLTEIAIMAQENMRKEKEFIAGVKQTMKDLPKTYEGSYLECARYINTRITIASINAINNPAYNGCIALYSAMNDIILWKATKEKD